MTAINSIRPTPSSLTAALRRLRLENTAGRQPQQLQYQQQQRCVGSVTTSTHEYRPIDYPIRGKKYTGIKPKPKHRGYGSPPAAPSIKSVCPHPNATFTTSQLNLLDPTGSRRRLISRTNPDRLKVGDVALVRFKAGEPFAGLVLNVRQRGHESGILLRNHLTRVGTEMWVKVFSPTVSGIEVVQRSQRKMRRARAYFFRKPKHDRGSLQGLVDNYIRQSRMLGRGGDEDDKRATRRR